MNSAGENINVEGDTALRAWWDTTSASIRDMCLSKADAYGARDLEIMGAASGHSGGRQIEWAVAFYALGKIARILSAIESGDPHTNDDSWTDLVAYAMMGMKAGHTGTWV